MNAMHADLCFIVSLDNVCSLRNPLAADSKWDTSKDMRKRGFGAGAALQEADAHIFGLFWGKKEKLGKFLGMIVGMACRKISVQAGGCT